MARLNGNRGYYNLSVTVYNQKTGDFSNSRHNGDKGIIRLPATFNRSGSYKTNSRIDRNDKGRYWESSFYSSTGAMFMYFTPGSFTPQNNNAKGEGYPLRCGDKIKNSSAFYGSLL